MLSLGKRRNLPCYHLLVLLAASWGDLGCPHNHESKKGHLKSYGKGFDCVKPVVLNLFPWWTGWTVPGMSAGQIRLVDPSHCPGQGPVWLHGGEWGAAQPWFSCMRRRGSSPALILLRGREGGDMGICKWGRVAVLMLTAPLPPNFPTCAEPPQTRCNGFVGAALGQWVWG